MKIMVSGCLLGENCKYSGGNNFNEKLVRLLEGHEVISVCPEVMGGLSVPRIPCEIVDGVVMGKDGVSYDAQFVKGAELTLEIAKREEIDLAILQPRSPSCGKGIIYDGTFTGGKTYGDGKTARLLIDHGFHVLTASEAEEVLINN